MNLFQLLKYILLGIIQGFTEPLPISSSGHLVIFEKLFHLDLSNDLNFEIIVNAGSLIAIVFIFRKDIWSLIVNSYSYIIKKDISHKKDFQYVLLLILAVIPAGVFGFLFKDMIETTFKTLLSVGIGLLITSLALYLVSKQALNNTKTDISLKDAIVIGLFQVVALIPGISRSGSTMVGGLTRKIKFEDTMRFSFLLYIPISVATLFLGLLDLDTSNIFVIGYIGAFLCSIVSTFFAVKWFFRMVRQGNLKYFSVYCLVVGFLVVIASFIVEV